MVLARHGFGHIVGSFHLPLASRFLNLFRKKSAPAVLSQPERVRRVFEELGPTFIKFGQLLSTRPDVLPPEYIAELTRLQDHADALPFATLQSTLEEDLEQSHREAFAEIDEEPLGSASLAQVHRAKTKEGDDVVIKIQRPGVERIIRRDLQLLNLIADLLADRKELAHFDPQGMVRIFERAIWRELDFRHELHSIERIARQTAGDPVRIPRTYPRYSTRRVLTMEYIPGPALKRAVLSPGLGHRLARDLSTALFNQIFIHGLFHADPHPGNLVYSDGGILALLDFGSVARLSPGALNELVGLVTSAVQRDYMLLARQIVRSGYVSHEVDVPELAAELVDFLDPYYDLPLSDIEIGPLVNALFALLMQYRIRIPAHYVLLGRALITLEGSVRLLDPEFSLIEELKPQLKRLFVTRWKPSNLLRELRLDFYTIASTLRDMPAAVGDMLHRIQEGNLRARIAVEDLQSIERRLDRLNTQLPLALLASSLLLSGTVLLVQRPDSNLAVTAGIASYIVAGLLGLWFLRPARH